MRFLSRGFESFSNANLLRGLLVGKVLIDGLVGDADHCAVVGLEAREVEFEQRAFGEVLGLKFTEFDRIEIEAGLLFQIGQAQAESLPCALGVGARECADSGFAVCIDELHLPVVVCIAGAFGLEVEL